MAGTTPDMVVCLHEDVIGALVPDANSPHDRFVAIYLGKEEIDSVDLDRRHTVAIVEGPEFSGASSCMETILIEDVYRYYTARDSRSRMVLDVRILRRAIRGMKTASLTGLAPEVAAAQAYIKPPRIESISYDYESVLGLTLVTFLVRYEYHVDVMTV